MMKLHTDPTWEFSEGLAVAEVAADWTIMKGYNRSESDGGGREKCVQVR